MILNLKMSAPPIAILQEFLSSNLTADKRALLKSTTNDLREFIEQNFDVMDENILRALIAAALKNRDDNLKKGKEGANAEELLGTWGVVIDTVREVTGQRQHRASTNFQSMLATAKQGEPKLAAAALTKLFREQQLDRLFMDLLQSMYEQCQQAGHEEYVSMLRFFMDVIDKNKAVAASLATRAAAASVAASVTPPDSAAITLPAAPPPSKAASIVSSSSAALLTTDNRVEELGTDSDDDEEEDEAGEEEELDEDMPVLEDAPGGMGEGLSAANHSHEALLAAGDYLTHLLEQYKGDAPALKDRAQSDLCERRLPFDLAALTRVVSDHLAAAQQAGYVNRVRFMTFMLDKVLKPVETLFAKSGTESGIARPAIGGSSESTYHAPKFVDELRRDYGDSAVLIPEAFIDASPAGLGRSAVAGRGSKAAKKESKRLLASVAKKVGVHLEEHGWASCDNFLPVDLVRRVRIEAGLFTEHYEQSEIWVGKQADVGTLLSVPSVRGDKVIWMCGGHKGGAPEGMTRVVRTAGEIEPCRLEAKARAPMRKFSALKELVSCCDKLMGELKKTVKSVEGVRERSDAMLANYPGNGTRFARHVDNTTQDGRRITLLVYLNPGWTPDKGGALRLTPPAREGDPESRAIDVFPECGRMALFYSATMPHEVMPTWGDRHAITLWYYDSEERAGAMKRAKDSGRAEAVARAGTDAQREAKLFIGDLMGGDEVDSMGGEPSKEELVALANKAMDLSPEALGIVASITGAPSADSFRQGFGLLQPQDLKQMRQLFRRMGLQD